LVTPLESHQRLGLRERKKQETAERIYRTALNLFSERGYDATTVEEIAQAAEVAKGTFFNYFPTKDAVLSYAGHRQMQLVNDAMARDPAFEERSVYEQLTLVFDTLAAGIQDDREAMRVVSLEVYRSVSAFSDTTSSARLLYELLLEIVRRGQERGELRAGIAEPAESMALLVMAAYFYTFFAWLELDDPPALALMLRVHLDLLLQGMKST
jgi:TetR/AcrR family transcriptional regulator, cholesterol catabolism regulator